MEETDMNDWDPSWLKYVDDLNIKQQIEFKKHILQKYYHQYTDFFQPITKDIDMSDTHEVKVIQESLESQGMYYSDLVGVLGTMSDVKSILKGERKLSTKNKMDLAESLGICF